ncbi:YebC/PmpR family DNA-binding transcriptional regulator [bacterium]|nr:YebC/PmpR family DNA-binding transcriptional regulator [bacterium]
MSGHSKWAKIKRKKGSKDEKRGRIFTKLIKEITVAARLGGGNPDSNARLRSAIESARAANMPAKNIENAIKKGTGELPGIVYEEVTYEGYGPNGIAILIEAATDNKKRTVADIRHILSKYGGNLGETGCVSWIFSKKGYITVPKSESSEEEILNEALDAGAEDILSDDPEVYEIYTSPEELERVKEALIKAGIPIESAEITAVPQSTVKIADEKTAERILKLMDALDENEDVQKLYSNFDIDDEILKKFG